jgi:hypothetical protein
MGKYTEIERVKHNMEILERKMFAYGKVREAINSLAKEYAYDPYVLEVLLAIDKTIFRQMQFVVEGLERLKRKYSELTKQPSP